MKKEKKETERKTSKLAIASFVLGIVSVILLIFFLPMIISPEWPISSIIPDFVIEVFISHYLEYLLVVLIFSSFLAIISGFFAFKQITKNPLLKGKTLAKIGLIIGVVCLSLIICGYILNQLTTNPGPVKLEPIR